MNHRVVLEINLKALVRNYRRIVARVKPLDVLCVLKANAYGLDVGAYAKALYEAGCRQFGVAEPYEALELLAVLGKDSGADVQILSSVLPDEIPDMVRAGVILPIIDFATARLISKAAKKASVTARVQFKIDTGMGRLGILAGDAPDVLRSVASLPNLDIEGIFSHCAFAYEPKNPFTKKQVQAFKKLLGRATEAGFCFRKVHIAASDVINNFSEAITKPFTLVRTGINLHGSFDPNGRRNLKVEPVLTLRTRIAQVRELPKGRTLGYGRTYRLKKRSRIATISAGYADGIPLALSNHGSVLIAGKRCPIVGRISMDYTTVDVSDLPKAKAGDDVICLGKSGKETIAPDDWAKLKATHAYDILCSINSRVERCIHPFIIK